MRVNQCVILTLARERPNLCLIRTCIQQTKLLSIQHITGLRDCVSLGGLAPS